MKSDVDILYDSKRAFQRIIKMIENSKESIFCMIFWVDMEDFSRALLRSSQEGVKVTLITDRRSFESINAGLFEEYMGSLSVASNSKLRVWDGMGLYHQKIIVIDGENLIIPSFNLTFNDINYNSDYCLFLRNPGFAKTFEREIENRIKDSSNVSLNSFLTQRSRNKRRMSKRKKRKIFSVFFLLFSNILVFLIYLGNM